MKFSIVLLCIVLGIFAIVDASVVQARDLNKREGNEVWCTPEKNHPAPAPAQSAPEKLANNDKAKQNGGSGKEVSSTSTEKSKATAKAPPPPAPPAGKNDKAKTSTSTTDAKTSAAVEDKKKGTSTADTKTSAAVEDKKGKGATSSSAANDTAETATATTNGKGSNKGTNNGGSNTCLSANALQTGSELTGQANGTEAGQVNSQTSDNNFINVCAGQTLTNGLQILNGSCNGIPGGFIPAKANMPSSLVAFPGHNEDLPANTNFTIAVTQQGMDLGFFTNAKLTYYSAPTFLNGDGLIIGHTHVTVQDLGGSFNPTTPADPTIFAFFLGINTPLNKDSQVFAAVPGGLPAGFYRVCTMVANANHSPVQMPVAQRGAQDDCKYFSVGQTNNPVAIPDFGNVTPAAAPAPAPAPAPAAPAPAPAATTSAAAGGKKGGKNGGGKNGNGKNRGGKLRRGVVV